MKHGLGVLALTFTGAVCAAEPPAPSPGEKPEVSKAMPAVATVTAKPADAAAPEARKPLDLRIGHFRNYMMPKEYLAAIAMPEPEKDTVVVEGTRLLVPMEQIENVPPGLASLWYAAKHPLNAWRLLAPMVNAPDPGPPDVVPKREFRWGP